MTLQDSVRITESCPRDGLQNVKEFVPTEDKVKIIKGAIDAGADEVEVTSFVHPKWVPQFQDAVEVFETVKEYAADRNVRLLALVPNKKGALRAKEAGVEIVNFVLSASEVHNKKNVNKTIDESLADYKEMMAEVEGLEIRLALACVFGSPFGDEIPVDRVLRICEKAYELGVSQIGLADSAGLSTPLNTRRVLKEISKHFDIKKMSIHLHDTRGMGIANAFVALEEGMRNFDTSLGALGGCPFIPGAKGNIATEDFVHMVKAMGLNTKYDLGKILELTSYMDDSLHLEIGSSMYKCMKCKS